MIFDGKNTESLKSFRKLKVDYDIQIIGAGIAGISLSYFLLKKKSNLKILLLERGGFINKPDAVKQNNFIKFAKLKIKKDSRIFGVGGTSLNWGNIVSYFTEDEMNKKWPLSTIQLNNYSLKAADLLDIKFPKKDKRLGLNERKFLYPKNPINFNKYLDTSKVDVMYNSQVISFNEKNNKTYSFIKTYNGSLKIQSSKLILCAGTLENVKLIKDSYKLGKLVKVNIKVLGKFFMNHPKFLLGEIDKVKNNLNIKKYLLKKNKGLFSYIGISLPKKIKNKKKLLNSYVRFKPKFEYILEKKIKSSDNFLKRTYYSSILKFLKLMNSFEFFFKQQGYMISVFLEMESNEKNKIDIVYKNKNSTKSEISVNYNLNKKDYLTFVELSKYVYKKFSSSQNYNEKKIIRKDQILKIAKDASHHMGGTSFNKNSKKSFIDKNLNILGYKNLFICSSSIFPTSGSVNPTIFIIGLALRLSEFILKNKNIR